MIADPPVRRDGTCRVCKKPRRAPSGRYVDRATHELDPFCSTVCCRKFHGLTTLTETGKVTPKRFGDAAYLED